jgi:hypothetical protein
MSTGKWVDITYSQLIVDSRWTCLDSEFARRLIGFMDLAIANNKIAYIGPTYRNDTWQRNVFLSSYKGSPTKVSGCVTWSGTDLSGKSYKYWVKISSDYPTTKPPGKSYHALVSKQNKTLGIDLMGYTSQLDWLQTNAAQYGLYYMRDSSDPFHVQPIDIPRSKVNYNPNTHSLSYYTFGTPSSSISGSSVIPQAPLYYNSLSNSSSEVYKLLATMKYWGWYTGLLRPDYDIGVFTAVKKMQTFLEVTASGTYDAATQNAYTNFRNSLSE